jgi:hypothetical protein
MLENFNIWSSLIPKAEATHIKLQLQKPKD